jgi:hypothetical protein
LSRSLYVGRQIVTAGTATQASDSKVRAA